jgi:hypothetical protein
MCSFLSFLKVYDKKKSHNMISLMLNPRYKSLHIVSSFVGREQGVVLVEEYDKKSLYPMLFKCHEDLHPLVRSKRNSIDQNVFDGDYSLELFEQTASTSEPIEKLVQRGFFIFREYPFDVKDIKCPLQWW